MGQMSVTINRCYAHYYGHRLYLNRIGKMILTFPSKITVFLVQHNLFNNTLLNFKSDTV